MEAIAKATNVKISSQKAKLVMDLIRGRAYSEARDILRFTNKRAAGLIFKVLETARANAEQQAQTDNVLVDVDDLWVKACYADTGTTKYRRRVRLRRWGAPIASAATTATSLWSSRARAARARPRRRNKFS